MARRVRVASRAVRRGRSLRPSEPPRARLEAEADAPEEPEPFEDDEEEELPPRRSDYSRPPAPALHLSPRATLEELAAMTEEPAPDEPAPDEPAPDEPATAEAAPDEPAAEPATEPLVDDGPLDDEVLGSTLASAGTPPPETRREGSPVVIEEAPEEPASSRPLTPRDGSLAPVVEELDDDEPIASPTPAQRRRQARLRRGVAIAVGAVALLAVGLGTKALLTKPDAERAAAAAVAEPPAAQPAPAEQASEKPTEPAEAQAAEPASQDAEAQDAEPGSDAQAAIESDPAKVRKETLRLLNKGEFEQATAWARRLIELEPGEAFGYRCLGSALQDLGRIQEAREIYSQCVKHATKGEVLECAALGGGKK